jgi:hypothetical protein
VVILHFGLRSLAPHRLIKGLSVLDHVRQDRQALAFGPQLVVFFLEFLVRQPIILGLLAASLAPGSRIVDSVAEHVVGEQIDTPALRP